MLGYALLACLAYTLLRLYQLGTSWRKNYLAAKTTGLPVFIVPVYAFSRWWTVLHEPIVVLLRKLPKSWMGIWLEIAPSLHQWWHKYSVFERIGSDTFITVSPGKVMCWTCDPECITQVTQRRSDFPKPLEAYKALDVYGKNVVSTEGQYWRHHRKIVAPPFGEKNNILVWIESLHQANNMIRGWTGMDGNQSRTITTVQTDAMRLSLYIISKAGFGKSLPWPGVEESRGGSDDSALRLSTGHKMTYLEALNQLLNSLTFIIVFPPWLLRISPFKKMRLAYEAYREWGSYMSEIYTEKRGEIDSGQDQSGFDLMGSMIRAAGGTEKGQTPLLSRDEIMGNSFVFMLAGHETTANALHFSFAFLAQSIPTQRRLQAELDSIFGTRPVSEWSYEKDLPKLFGGLVGASMAEQLRLVPGVLDLPKKTETPQGLVLGGRRYVLPAECVIFLCGASAHRNPKYWPHGPPTDPNDPHHPESNTDNDLEEFKPERWLDNAPSGTGAGDSAVGAGIAGTDQGTRTDETDELAVNTAADNAATLFKPVKGSYFPFSEGHRSCLGRRFAQVEYMAVMAVILREWSVELAVDEWASDEEVEKMSVPEKKEVWEKANHKVRTTMRDGMCMRITLQFKPGENVAFRFVRRGKERFNWAEAEA